MGHQVKTHTTYESRQLLSYSATEAVVATVDYSTRLSGSFYADNRMKVIYSLHPNKDGQWLIYKVEPQSVEYTNVDDQLQHPATFRQRMRRIFERSSRNSSRRRPIRMCRLMWQR